jgi:hypothetical protein
MIINSGPAALASQGGTYNTPFISVTLCQPGSTTCATIPYIAVDTGSAGLRVFASVLTSAGLNLPVMNDPNNPANTVAECLPFLDGYAWGPIVTAALTVGGESVSSLSVQIFNDNNSYVPSVPTSCTQQTANVNEDSIAVFGANGVIGVNFLAQDCGPSCSTCNDVAGGCTANNDMYYSCNAGTNTCSSVQVALASQVVNPVAKFTTDNNGVILQFPSIPEAGAANVTGNLIFGISTESNNALGSASVLTLDDEGFFTSTFNGTALTAFIDSGSTDYFFPDNSLTLCPNQKSGQPEFYCPTSTVMLSTVNQGNLPNGTPAGAMNTVQFLVADFDSLSNSNTAFDDIGLTAPATGGDDSITGYFDFGLPFFFGRSVYTGIVGESAGVGGPTGPYYAY